MERAMTEVWTLSVHRTAADRIPASSGAPSVFVKVSLLGNRLALDTSDISNTCEPAFLD
jgi:hypothetical protein